MGGETLLSYRPQLLDYDAPSGVIRKFHGGDDGTDFIESVQQDVGPLMRENAEMRKRTSGSRHQGFGSLVARYPIAMWEEWVRKGLITVAGKVLDDAAFSKEVMNNPDISNFRTREGKF